MRSVPVHNSEMRTSREYKSYITNVRFARWMATTRSSSERRKIVFNRRFAMFFRCFTLRFVSCSRFFATYGRVVVFFFRPLGLPTGIVFLPFFSVFCFPLNVHAHVLSACDVKFPLGLLFFLPRDYFFQDNLYRTI